MKAKFQTVLGAAAVLSLLGACTHRDAGPASLSNSAANGTAPVAVPAPDMAVAPATVTSGTTTEVNDSVAQPAQTKAKSNQAATSESSKKSVSQKVYRKTTIINEAPAAYNEGDRNLRDGTVGSGTGSDTHSTVSKGQTDNDPQQR